LFLELSKGNYEFLTRPKSKIGFEIGTTLKPVSVPGEGLLLKIGSCFGPEKVIMACGWTTPKTKPLYARIPEGERKTSNLFG
jgi:hypothetical protein